MKPKEIVKGFKGQLEQARLYPLKIQDDNYKLRRVLEPTTERNIKSLVPDIMVLLPPFERMLPDFKL